MKTDLKIKEKYLIMFPFKFNKEEGETIKFTKVKDAPYFMDLDIECRQIKNEETEIEGTNVKIDYQSIENEVIIAQAEFDLGNKLDESVINKKSELIEKIKSYMMNTFGINEEFSEEYSTIFISGTKVKPETFLSKNKFLIARLIRSIKERIGESDVEEILFSKLSYTENDLMIVDWEGSVIINQYESDNGNDDLNLVKIANYQLLRYRMLDDTIDKSVEDLRRIVNKKRKWIPQRNVSHEKILKTKIKLLLDFERIDQFLLFIGDWYSAKLYRTIYDEIYLDQWRKIVKDKLETLSEIYETLNENIIVSWKKLGGNVELLGWLILLAGYFILFYLDTRAY